MHSSLETVSDRAQGYQHKAQDAECRVESLEKDLKEAQAAQKSADQAVKNAEQQAAVDRLTATQQWTEANTKSKLHTAEVKELKQKIRDVEATLKLSQAHGESNDSVTDMDSLRLLYDSPLFPLPASFLFSRSFIH